jgi:GTP-binding protein EngB required for normal cell division
MNGLRVKDVNDLHINFQTQQTQVSNILVFFRHRQEIESMVAAKKMDKIRATKRKTKSDAVIDCCHRNDIRIKTGPKILYVFKLISKSTRTDRGRSLEVKKNDRLSSANNRQWRFILMS